MSQLTTQRVDGKALRQLVERIFQQEGLSNEDAAVVADSLVAADERGVYSHGVMRVATYVKALRSGGMRADARPSVVSNEGANAVIDGQWTMGQVGSNRAMVLAIEKAREHGVGLVGLRNSHHCGAMAYWAMMALPADCIGFATTNAGMNMAPWGGVDKIIGNNPFAVAIPTNRDWPMVLDMATSVVAGGKLDIASIRGQKIPLDWALGPDGQPTDDPRQARLGTLLPVGGPKGYGMAVMLDVLAGVLTGARFGGGLGPGGSGQFFMAIRVDAFMPVVEFKSRMDEMIDQINHSTRAEGVERIYVPGEIEFDLQRRRETEGLLVESAIMEELESLAGPK
ncbi:MAG TPA: Ldh family oxidoreductase [Chloroflexota bacterium]|nr:Ldh family oxidoreductase [Chloroflexota bacterium]